MINGERGGVWRPIGAIVILVLLIAAASTLDLDARLHATDRWIEDLGPWGPLAFVLLSAVATVAAVPATAPTVIAGGLFGAFWGTLWVSLGISMGAMACFVIARYLARDAAVRWLHGKPMFDRLDRLTETHGAWVVAVTRVVPVFPYNVLNYGFGLTHVRFSTYALVSWVAMLPCNFLYVAGADAVTRGVKEGRVPWGLVAAATSVLGALLAIGWVVRRRLRAAETPR